METVKINLKTFDILSRYVESHFGIQLPLHKKSMVESRLYKRLNALNLDNYEDYLHYLFSPSGKEELFQFVNIISTHKTDFFREADHFDFLKKIILKKWTFNQIHGNLFRVWSAGASTGEEVYSLAMTVEEFIKKEKQTNMNYHIIGTDVSTEVLAMAKKAIYSFDSVKDIPVDYQQKYILKSKDKKLELIRIIPELRAKVELKYLNFMWDEYPIQSMMDVIFFRNVMIYFNRETQEKILEKIIKHLKKDGFLIIGHSESILNFKLPLKNIQATIFQKE
ncbi:MAG TPA: chemotaxis protein CheR [Spirochaetia bacterium]|nr:chemotaxis protein CheR [Spirochaetia bacterium]